MMRKRPEVKDLVWLFVIGGLLGFILETVWYLIKHGVIINKQGLLYGPFKPIYGFGLIIIVLLMVKFQDKKLWQKFILGVIIGSAFEYFGSIFQEVFLGTSTWNYGAFKLSLGSRLYIPYCLIWGVIAIIVVDFLYPLFLKVISKVPLKIYNFITYFLIIFMVVNLSLTTVAIMRYSARARRKDNTNFIYRVIDEVYTDEYMRKKFPKLKIINKK